MITLVIQIFQIDNGQQVGQSTKAVASIGPDHQRGHWLYLTICWPSIGCISSGAEVVALTMTKPIVKTRMIYSEGLGPVVSRYTRPGKRVAIWLSYHYIELC